MIALIDYDAGNVRSVEKAFSFLGREAFLTRDPEEIRRADAVVLPGVGSFGDAMEKLQAYALTDVLCEVIICGKPFLGICLGLQLLFEGSEESPAVSGLSVLAGSCRRFDETAYAVKVPQIGWNSLDFPRESRLFRGVLPGSFVYFVHSYYAEPAKGDVVTATTTHGLPVTAAIERGNLFACQFHPEKSGAVGLAILQNFLDIVDEEGRRC